MNENEYRDALNNLLKEGSASYLDAVYALDRFTREVINIAVAVFTPRLAALMSAAGTEALPSPFAPFISPGIGGRDYSGNWAWVMTQIWFPEPWKRIFHLGLYFERCADNGVSTPYVTFMWKRASVPSGARLNALFRNNGHYFTDPGSYESGFRWKLTNLSDLTAEFEKMMDYVKDELPKLAAIDP